MISLRSRSAFALQGPRNRVSQAINNDPTDQLLDAYFWHFVDRGDALEDTPLFTGIQDGDALGGHRAGIRLPPHEAESAIDIARRRSRYEPRHL